ncbi:MAG: ribosome silencing factor [Actinobacteria bacterium]|nr:ribosome silencing factor [Actinomycetota bacterium]
MAPRRETLLLLERASAAALDKLAKNLVAVDLTEQMVLSEVFLIASGQNERQIEAIADNIEMKLAAQNERPVRREKSSRWILLDYEDLVVHVQTEEIRNYYMLERLWNDCPRIEISAIENVGGEDK